MARRRAHHARAPDGRGCVAEINGGTLGDGDATRVFATLAEAKAAAFEVMGIDESNPLSEAEADELCALRALAAEAEDYAEDWSHGVTLIRDSYFTDYAREYAQDIGAIKANAKWPHDCIDWDKAADELREDYSAVEFGRVTYWVR